MIIFQHIYSHKNNVYVRWHRRYQMRNTWDAKETDVSEVFRTKPSFLLSTHSRVNSQHIWKFLVGLPQLSLNHLINNDHVTTWTNEKSQKLDWQYFVLRNKMIIYKWINEEVSQVFNIHLHVVF